MKSSTEAPSGSALAPSSGQLYVRTKVSGKGTTSGRMARDGACVMRSSREL